MYESVQENGWFVLHAMDLSLHLSLHLSLSLYVQESFLALRHDTVYTNHDPCPFLLFAGDRGPARRDRGRGAGRGRGDAAARGRGRGRGNGVSLRIGGGKRGRQNRPQRGTLKRKDRSFEKALREEKAIERRTVVLPE